MSGDSLGRRIVTTVWCGECTGERRGTREQLGHVVSDGKGSKSWFVYDDRRKRLPNAALSLPDDFVAQVRPLPGEEFLAGVPLVTATSSHYEPPPTLFAFCSRHGRGSVATSDVLSARGSVVLNFIAQA